MGFVLWVCRTMHIFGAIVWLGGLMFQSAVAAPIFEAHHPEAGKFLRSVNRRFMGFVWMSAWTMGVTGVLLMLLSPQFLWFRYDNAWSVLLGLKQVIFILMVIYAFGYARMLKFLESPSSNGGFTHKTELYRHRLRQFRSVSIALGILAIALAAAL